MPKVKVNRNSFFHFKLENAPSRMFLSIKWVTCRGDTMTKHLVVYTNCYAIILGHEICV